MGGEEERRRFRMLEDTRGHRRMKEDSSAEENRVRPVSLEKTMNC